MKTPYEKSKRQFKNKNGVNKRDRKIFLLFVKSKNGLIKPTIFLPKLSISFFICLITYALLIQPPLTTHVLIYKYKCRMSAHLPLN